MSADFTSAQELRHTSVLRAIDIIRVQNFIYDHETVLTLADKIEKYISTGELPAPPAVVGPFSSDEPPF